VVQSPLFGDTVASIHELTRNGLRGRIALVEHQRAGVGEGQAAN